MFCLRMSRKVKGNSKFGSEWKLATIGETDRTARDFGSLIPEIRGFCRDLFPDTHIDPNERVAIMNKEVTIRVKDYAPERNKLPSVLAMGLAWDVTDGVNIDLGMTRAIGVAIARAARTTGGTTWRDLERQVLLLSEHLSP